MDIKAINDCSTAYEVARYIGIEMEQKGNYTMIRCPGHRLRLGKDDGKIGNAWLTKHGYTCKACNVFVNTHDMVMEFLNCDSHEAYITMANAMGRPDLIDAENAVQVELPKIKLSKDELKYLKLNPKILDLFYIDKWSYYNTIHQRAIQMLEKYQKLINLYGANGTKQYEFSELMGDHYDKTQLTDLNKELTIRIDKVTTLKKISENILKKM